MKRTLLPRLLLKLLGLSSRSRNPSLPRVEPGMSLMRSSSGSISLTTDHSTPRSNPPITSKSITTMDQLPGITKNSTSTEPWTPTSSSTKWPSKQVSYTTQSIAILTTDSSSLFNKIKINGIGITEPQLIIKNIYSVFFQFTIFPKDSSRRMLSFSATKLMKIMTSS